MVKYEYRSDLEAFKRIDNREPSLKFNIVEARRIESMLEMGTKLPTIYKNIDFVNDVSMTNLRTFVKNLEEGNINLEGDYPSPTVQLEDINYEIRISKLEEDIETIKKSLLDIKSCDCKSDESVMDKVKQWLKQ